MFFSRKVIIFTSNWTPTAGLTKTDFEYSLDQTDKPNWQTSASPQLSHLYFLILSSLLYNLFSLTPPLSFTISPSQFVSLLSVASTYSLPLHRSLNLSLLTQGQPDGHRGAVVSSMEDCRSGAKWPLNGSQTHTGFIDALAWRQQASTLCVCVCVCQGGSGADCMLIIQNSPTPLWKLLNIDGVERQNRDRWKTQYWCQFSYTVLVISKICCINI